MRFFVRIGLETAKTGICTRKWYRSVSKRYQTGLFAQLSKILLENVNFELIYSIFIIQKPPSKITRYRVDLPKEDVSGYSVGQNAVHIKQKLISVSSRLTFEETSVGSC